MALNSKYSIRRLCSNLFKKEISQNFMLNQFNIRRTATRRFTSKGLNGSFSNWIMVQRPKTVSKMDASNLFFPNRISIRLFQSSVAVFQKDYYKILHVQKGALAEDIKTAYYDLAKKYHPDINKGKVAAETFQEIQQAYEILGDTRKRAAYDISFSGTGREGPAGGFSYSSHGFGTNRGRGGSFSHPSQEFEGKSSSYVLNISFMDAVKGVIKDVCVEVQTICKRCRGNKAEPGTTLRQCFKCKGTGEQRTKTGYQNMFNISNSCNKCDGHGTLIIHPCQSCDGKGSVVENQVVSIRVPAGIDNHQTLRQTLEYGELFVKFKVEKSKIFKRKGADVTSVAFISLSQCILGGSIKTPGIHGDIDLAIRPGTKLRQQRCLIGQGIPQLNGCGRGDHYINIEVQLPQSLSRRQKELIKEFAALDDSISGTVCGVDCDAVRPQPEIPTDSINDRTTTKTEKTCNQSYTMVFDSPHP